jgi:uncharacterized protein (DUF1697 family)
MPTRIALFRGINVGGRNVLPMKELVRDLEALKLTNIRTYIQSGNVVFDTSSKSSAALERKIAEAIEKRHGFRPEVLIITPAQLAAAIEGNPYPEAEDEPKTLHLSFLAATPKAPDLDAMEKIKSPTERFHLAGDVLYLHAPDGIGRSRLAAQIEKHLGVPATGRNWRTVCKLLDMV